MKEEINIWVEEIKLFIAKGNTEDAIELLLSKTNEAEALSEIRKQVLLVAGRYREFEKNKRIGIVALGDNTLEIVNANLIEILSEVEEMEFCGRSVDLYKFQDSNPLQAASSKDWESINLAIQGDKLKLKERNRVVEKLYKDLGEPIFNF